jgi:hypothetical protein
MFIALGTHTGRLSRDVAPADGCDTCGGGDHGVACEQKCSGVPPLAWAGVVLPADGSSDTSSTQARVCGQHRTQVPHLARATGDPCPWQTHSRPGNGQRPKTSPVAGSRYPDHRCVATERTDGNDAATGSVRLRRAPAPPQGRRRNRQPARAVRASGLYTRVSSRPFRRASLRRPRPWSGTGAGQSGRSRPRRFP